MTDADPPPTIAIEHLSRSFGDNQVVADVSLTVEPGELVGLVGPNGAGKTTLLRATSGALEPDDGTVEIDGIDVNAAPSKVASRLVAVVPQDTALSFSFPVRDVVAMGRYPHRSRFSPATDDDRRAVDRALERTRTTELADRNIDEISGGQRQRVIVARAIAQETPALLLDEPTASLDVNHQLETLELVRELVDDGTAAMAAIHDLSLAARYCDRLALLAGGTIRRVGSPEEVLTADAVGDAFDASAVVATDPISGAMSVTALPNRPSAAEMKSESLTDPETPGETHEPPPAESGGRTQPSVHVLGAGSIASSAVARLALAGVRLTIGPLPTGDVTAETAGQFDIEPIETGPFSTLSESATADAIDAVDRADAVVVADPILGDDEAFGRLLEAVLSSAVVIGVSDGGTPSKPPNRDVGARGVVAPERVPARMHELLTMRFETGSVVDLESIVEEVERELETDQSNPGSERTTTSRGDPKTTTPSQDVERTIEAETDGGSTSSDRLEDGRGMPADQMDDDASN